jgi:predicted TIM-barrel fold metal-dependent hydrolase
MDAEGVEMAIIYPTLGMNGFSAIDDPKVAGGLCRAYNRWVAEFASPNPKRLRPAMFVPLNHPKVALAELQYARETLGLSIVFANPTPIPGLNWHHPAYDPFWAAAQDLGILFTFHEGTAGTANATGLDRYEMYPMTYLCGHVVEMQLAAMDVILGGVLERFPNLSIGFVESHIAWLPGWLALLDDQFSRTSGLFQSKGGKGPLALKPSEYFRCQCFIVAFPDDTLLKEAADAVGEGQVLLSSDYPHPQTRYEVVKTLHEAHPGIGPALEAKLLRQNALAILEPVTQ